MSVEFGTKEFLKNLFDTLWFKVLIIESMEGSFQSYVINKADFNLEEVASSIDFKNGSHLQYFEYAMDEYNAYKIDIENMLEDDMGSVRKIIDDVDNFEQYLTKVKDAVQNPEGRYDELANMYSSLGEHLVNLTSAERKLAIIYDKHFDD